MKEICVLFAISPWLFVLTVCQFQLYKYFFYSTKQLKKDFPDYFK